MIERIVTVTGDGIVRSLRGLFNTLELLLPQDKWVVVAKFLGFLLLFGKRERTSRRMFLVLGGGVPREKMHQIWVGYRRHIGVAIREMARMEVMDHEDLRRNVAIEGEEQLKAVLSQNHGAVVLFNHFGSMASIAAGLGLRGYDISIVTNGLRFPSVDQGLDRLFKNCNAKRLIFGDQLHSSFLQVVRKNGIFAATVDYAIPSTRPRHGIWVPFANAEILVNPGPAIIALRQNVPILFTTCRRNASGGHRLKIHAPLKYEPSKDTVSDALVVMQHALELLLQDIMISPSEWWIWDGVPLRRKTMSSAARKVPETAFPSHPVLREG